MPPFSGETESITNKLVRDPTLVVDMPSPSDETFDPLKCHWTSIGKSPSEAKQVTWVADPDRTASSPKLNGMILGATGNEPDQMIGKGHTERSKC